MRRNFSVPFFGLYGEGKLFPEVVHVERIFDRAEGHAWNIAPHRHPHLHQFLILHGGQADVSIEDSAVSLKAGQTINLPPWTVHGFKFDPFTEGLVISLPVAEFADLLASGPGSARLKHWFITDSPRQLTETASALYDSFLGEGFAREHILKSYGTLLGLHLAGSTCVADRDHPPKTSDNLVMRFEGLVRERFRDRLKLSDYADALAVSASHLSRTCREITGTSASRFIESVVFKEACNNLAYTAAPVAQIGYDLGFHDAAYFSRAFRKHTGMSPGDYRRAMTDGVLNGQKGPKKTN